MNPYMITIDNKPWRFITNIDRQEKMHMEKAAELAKVEIKILDNAVDRWRKPLSHCLAVYGPAEYYEKGNKQIDKLFFVSHELSRKYKEVLLGLGVTEEEIGDKLLYLGCEEEYFPRVAGVLKHE